MPNSPFVDMPQEKPAELLATLRRAIRLPAGPPHPMAVCHGTPPDGDRRRPVLHSRSRVYRTVQASQRERSTESTTPRGGSCRRCAPRDCSPRCDDRRWPSSRPRPERMGGCRTRWRGATLALLLQVNRGLTVSAETMRRWLPEIGWVGKQAKRVARDDDPPRVNRLARSRWVFEPHEPSEAMVFADARDLHPWPHVGGAWRPQGTQVAVMTPGQHQQHSLAGASSPQV